MNLIVDVIQRKSLEIMIGKVSKGFNGEKKIKKKKKKDHLVDCTLVPYFPRLQL